MLLTPLGGCQERGRNCFLITWDTCKFLLDCGVSPSFEKQNPRAFPHLERVKMDELNAVIVSHAHEDHVGMLPRLYEMGYTGEVYVTKPTEQLVKDACKRWLSALDDASVPKPYPETSIEAIRPIGIDNDETTSIAPDADFFFSASGHMLGSAMVNVRLGRRTFLYTSDYYYGSHLLPDPRHNLSADVMLCDAFYGNFQYPKITEREEFFRTIRSCIDRRGKVLLPLPLLGRSQEVVAMILEKLDSFQNVRIFIENELKEAWMMCMNTKSWLRQETLDKPDSDCFKRLSELTTLENTEDRLQAIGSEGPAIILGYDSPKLNLLYAQRMSDDMRNLFLFSGYQAPGSVGRILQSDSSTILANEQNKKQLAEVKHIELRTHPDVLDTLRFILSLKEKPELVLTFHGEGSRCLEMATVVESEFGIQSRAPMNLEEISI
ncbi:MAG: MBL fold metallo-hydrolase [Candidatus Bathyarchaeia archaeon]